MLLINSAKKETKPAQPKPQTKDKSNLIAASTKYGKSAPKNVSDNKTPVQAPNKKESFSTTNHNQPKDVKPKTDALISNIQKPVVTINSPIVPSSKVAKLAENIKAKEKEKKEIRERNSVSRNKETYHHLGITKSTTTMFSKYSKTNIFKTVTSRRFDTKSTKKMINLSQVKSHQDTGTSFFKEMETTMGKLNLIGVDKGGKARPHSQQNDYSTNKGNKSELAIETSKSPVRNRIQSELTSSAMNLNYNSNMKIERRQKTHMNNSVVTPRSQMDNVFSSIISNNKSNSMNSRDKKRGTRKPIKNIYELSKTGYAGENKKKINQDNYFVYRGFNGDDNSIYLGVCDGHGANGHDVSAYLKEAIPKTLDVELKKRGRTQGLKAVVQDVFNTVNYKLKSETQIDVSLSGSTCNSVIYTPDRLVICNVGDSRTILGRFVNGFWKSYNLSRDHKPDDKEEMERIKARRGRVEAYKGNICFTKDSNGVHVGPARVWLLNGEAPGLAMSRSFGDQIASTVGVICEPEITEWEFTKEDMFMITGSDGVFEFFQTQEIVEIVKNYYLKNDIKACAEHLIEESSKRWMREEEIIDDITLIVVFFE